MLAMAVPIFSAPKSAEEQLAEVNFSIVRLKPVVDRYRDSVTSLNQRRVAVMKEYGVTVTPSVVEMRRDYPRLYVIERNLKAAQDELDRVEPRLIRLYMRRQELERQLGLRPREEPLPRHYPATKGYIPPEERRSRESR
jgi:uncharacterized coiled-coil protein SlyX